MQPQPDSVPSQRDCIHCGTPFSTRGDPDAKFCCNGCAYVHNLISSQGLDHYYDLRDRRISPVNAAALHKRDFAWLAKLEANAAAKNPHRATAVFDLEGIACVGCVWLIEKVFHALPGAQRIEINTQYGQVRLQWHPGLFPLEDFARHIQQFGYVLGPPGDRNPAESQRMLMRLGIAAVCALNAMLFTLPRYLGMQPDFIMAGLFERIALLFATLSLFAGGSYFIRRAFTGLRRKIIHIDFPIALGVLCAYLGSLVGWLINDSRFLYFDFVAIFIFLMLVGRWLQERALESNRHRLLSSNKAPRSVTVIGDDLLTTESVSVEALEPGQRFRLLPGEVNPVFATLESISAATSLEWINGESAMRPFTRNQQIPAGAVNIGVDPIVLLARQPWADSLLSRLVDIAPADDRNPLFERFLRAYLLSVLAIAALGLLTWSLLGHSLTGWQAALSVLVVSCPCALGVALPFAAEVAILQLRNHGLFVRHPTLFPRLRAIRKLFFDKTGTLTLEAPALLSGLPDLHALTPLDRAVLRSMVDASLHPVARALRDALLAVPTAPDEFPPADLLITEQVGAGLIAQSTSSNATWFLGKPSLHPSTPSDANGQTLFSAQSNNACRCLARFTFAEALRDDAATAIKALQQRFEVAILSGDHSAKVLRLAQQLGIPAHHARGDLSPDAKAASVSANDPASVLFLGDGANDAFAFQSAAVRGTPATPNGLLNAQADFFFTGRSLNALLALFDTAATHRRAQSLAITFSIAYNIITVSIALSGLMHPLLAAILMPISSLATLALVRIAFRAQP